MYFFCFLKFQRYLNTATWLTWYLHLPYQSLEASGFIRSIDGVDLVAPYKQFLNLGAGLRSFLGFLAFRCLFSNQLCAASSQILVFVYSRSKISIYREKLCRATCSCAILSVVVRPGRDGMIETSDHGLNCFAEIGERSQCLECESHSRCAFFVANNDANIRHVLTG